MTDKNIVDEIEHAVGQALDHLISLDPTPERPPGEMNAARRRVIAMNRIWRYARLERVDAPMMVLEKELELIGKALAKLDATDLVAIVNEYPSWRARREREIRTETTGEHK